MPNSLGVRKRWDIPKDGTYGTPREKEKGEEERAWGNLLGIEGC